MSFRVKTYAVKVLVVKEDVKLVAGALGLNRDGKSAEYLANRVNEVLGVEKESAVLVIKILWSSDVTANRLSSDVVFCLVP